MNGKTAAIIIVLANLFFVAARQAERPQNEPEVVAGKPIAGVQVKLSRYSGAQFGGGGMRKGSDGMIRPNDPVWSRTARTDVQGRFVFQPVEKGQYVLTVERPNESSERSQTSVGNTTVPTEPRRSEVKVALLIIEGGLGGRMTVAWDFAANQRYASESPASAVRRTEPPILIESNGKDPLSGLCAVGIVKPKSNIPTE